MRQDNEEEHRERPCTVHACCLLLLAVEGLDGREQDEQREGQPLPCDDDNDGSERKAAEEVDRKSTRLNSSHANISYAVFCLKKKKIIINNYHSFINNSYTS